jgi:ABC-type dipeptide/oligopeptide/nickel transport system permease subunit
MRLTIAAILLAILVTAVRVVWCSPWSYAAQDRNNVSASISKAHPAGSDELGRDRAMRTATALLIGMAGAIAASALASLLAVALGTGAAFLPLWAGRAVIYAGDLFLTLPWLFLLMMVRAALPLTLAPVQSAAVTFLLLGLLGAPAFLRVHYARTAGLRRAEWLLQSRAAGLRPLQLVRQILPHLRPLLLTQFLLYIPACIIAEANLGTLGLGIGEPLPSWGSMLQSLQSAVLLSNSRLVYLPVAVLVLVLMLLELLIFDPQEMNQ